jgi:P-type conjugative transfer protein TrbL
VDILTSASETYMNTFHGFQNQFTEWGQWIFFSFLVINIVWLSLWYAFDKHSFSETIPSFIKRFFIIAFFYTIMMNPSWIMSILKTAQFMGSSLTHSPIDPSSIISVGIGLGNKIIAPFLKSSLLMEGVGFFFVLITYVIVLFVFIMIAIELAVTLILTSALISIATFFLGFAALETTSQISRQCLDVVLGNCVKLLGIYLVVAVGSQSFSTMATQIPTTLDQLKHTGFDVYGWIIAVSVLFYVLAKTLPSQLAKIVSGSIQETNGAEIAALSVAAITSAKSAMEISRVASNTLSELSKLAGSTAFNAAAHFGKGVSSGNLIQGLGAAVTGSTTDLGKATAGRVSDQFKNIATKLTGGEVSQKPIASISERLYKSAKDIKSNN